MKLSEIRELTVEEIDARIEDQQRELFDGRMKHAMRQLENTAALSRLRHEISQLKTVKAEKLNPPKRPQPAPAKTEAPAKAPAAKKAAKPKTKKEGAA